MVMRKSISNTVLSIITKVAIILFVLMDFIVLRRSIDIAQAVVLVLLFITAGISLLMFIRKNENTLMNAALYGVMCGFFILQRSFDGFETDDAILVMKATVECALGVMMICLNIFLCGGNRYNQMRLFILSAFSIVFVLLSSISTMIMEDAYLWDVMGRYAADFGIVAVIVFYVVILTRPEIRYYSLNKQMAYNVRTLNGTLFVNRDAYMLRSEFVKFVNSEWTSSDEEGVIETKSGIFFSDGMDAKITVKRCNDGKTYGSLHLDGNGTSVQGIRFPVTQLVYGDIDTCGDFTVYGEDGFFILMKIRDDYNMPKGRLKKFYYWAVGHPYE